MAKKKIDTEHVNYIYKQFEENYPNSVPKVFVIDKVIQYLIKFIKSQLEEDKDVQIDALGRFKAFYRLAPGKKHFQWYPKFIYSRHFVLNFRDKKGTASEAEKREIQKKKDFIGGVWKKRKEWMLENKGEIPENVLRYEKQFNS